MPPESDYLQRPDAKPWLKAREILNRWDPIGVSSSVEDEYDSYLPDLLRLLDSGATKEPILDYWRWIATDRMGLKFSRAVAEPLVDELLEFWHQ